ncbi:MAG: GGDEF domain-containing protein [Defluviitaleaceae bacterium]|nr:GGDEF domain-containing protein [Defluviitaleaceae bacterium]
MKNSEKKRKHYGVMFSTLDNANQNEIWRGVDDFAKEKDINLTAYISVYQAENNITSFADTCFDAMCNSAFLDGIILFSGFVSNDIGSEKFKGFVETIPKNVPYVSVSLAMPEVPSVLADGFNGTYNAVEHLIKIHGKKEIAFIKGPDGHSEAEERLAGFKKALEDNGLVFDANYVLPGAFIRPNGVEAVKTLIDERKLSFDSIVSSNDQMAIGALNELKNRNILVPTQVAVTGFDDDAESATFVPSISTAKQDFYQIGWVSAETLFKKINGEQVDNLKYVPPSFMMRHSCGCLDREFSEPLNQLKNSESLSSYVMDCFKTLFRDVPEKQIEEWATMLVRSLQKQNFDKVKFLHLFNDILVKYNYSYKNLYLWNDALNILTMGVEYYRDEIENAYSYSILSTLVSAASFVHEVKFKEERNKENTKAEILAHVRRLTGALVSRFDMDSMVEKLSSQLPVIGINTALIGIYRKPIKGDDPTADRSIDALIGFDSDRKFNSHNNSWNSIRFSDYVSFDGFNLERERRAFFFLPLFFENEELGVILLPYDPNAPVDSYERLRVSVSAAVKGVGLLFTIRMLSITDELTGLLNRRGFFHDVYSRLHYLSRSTEVIPVVMFMDMDGLKKINDTYGHNEGDIAISAFANILKEALRKEDIIGRIGGDEFVVFSSVKADGDNKNVENRIRDKIVEYNAKKLHAYDVSSSIGSVKLTSITKECFEEAMLNADSVLYEEKMRKKKLRIAQGEAPR